MYVNQQRLLLFAVGRHRYVVLSDKTRYVQTNNNKTTQGGSKVFFTSEMVIKKLVRKINVRPDEKRLKYIENFEKITLKNFTAEIKIS